MDEILLNLHFLYLGINGLFRFRHSYLLNNYQKKLLFVQFYFHMMAFDCFCTRQLL